MLYISAEALSPKGTDQVATDTATALKLLAIAAKHPTQLYIAGTCAVLGLGALAVSYAAIAALARNRGAAVATIAALIGSIGAFGPLNFGAHSPEDEQRDRKYRSARLERTGLKGLFCTERTGTRAGSTGGGSGTSRRGRITGGVTAGSGIASWRADGL